MAGIDGHALWRFADVIRGAMPKQEQPDRTTARLSYVDDEGVGWYRIDGSDIDTPCAGGEASEVEVGQLVDVELRGGLLYVTGNEDAPSVGAEHVTRAVAPALSRATQAVRESVIAQKLAAETRRIAEAVNQHFWHDTNGAHVTEVTQEEWGTEATGHNILLNSYGLLLRNALNWLASFTESATTFYDGQGTEAENITARFGTDGAQIGRDPDYTTTAAYFDTDGFYIKTRYDTPPYPMYEIVGVVATDGFVSDSTGYGVSTDWTYELDFAPASGTSIDVYSIGETGGNKSLTCSFSAGTAETISTWDGEYAYDGGSSIQHTADPSAVAASIVIIEYRKYSTVGNPWIHVGKIRTDEARAAYTISVGTDLLAASENQAVFGKYNVKDSSRVYSLIIGNGTSNSNRHNALTVDWDGNVEAAGGAALGGMETIASPTIADNTTYSANVGGNGVQFYNADDSFLGQVRAYARSGADRIRGVQIGGKNEASTAYNYLYLMVDKDGNRLVQVSEVAPWLDMLGITPSNTTMTINTTNTTSIGNNNVRRSGKVVTVQFTELKIAAAVANNTATGTLATIPSGYRPSWNVYFPLIRTTNAGSSYYRIDSSGNLIFRNVSGAQIAAGATFAGTVTYVIA